MTDFRDVKAPQISIVVPSYNAGATIGRALQSLAEQKYPNLQVICVDGQSRDDTLTHIDQFRPLVSEVISEPDKNSADALNKGFRKATGHIFGWLCADDKLAPNALFTVVDAFERCPKTDVVTGGCRRFYADGSEEITTPPKDLQKVISMKNYFEQPSTFWKKSLHRKAGELDISFNLAFDHEWWCRFAACGANFLDIPDVLSHYHFSHDNLTSVGGRRLVREMYRITKKYGPYRGLTADIYRILYYVFDLNGYYDHDSIHKIPPWKLRLFNQVLYVIKVCFGDAIIDNYNWSFASKQERGICWYKS
ncbi:MAG: glycosyltransferase [Syntrophaceae bacterium]|nr:glycosyltransferase [Syntrophaceae bacterium]